jgi:hypothetical protein
MSFHLGGVVGEAVSTDRGCVDGATCGDGEGAVVSICGSGCGILIDGGIASGHCDAVFSLRTRLLVHLSICSPESDDHTES